MINQMWIETHFPRGTKGAVRLLGASASAVESCYGCFGLTGPLTSKGRNYIRWNRFWGTNECMSSCGLNVSVNKFLSSSFRSVTTPCKEEIFCTLMVATKSW